LTTATTETARLTSDPVPPDELRADVARLFEAMALGGIGIVPLDVAYAVVSTMANRNTRTRMGSRARSSISAISR
jgi:hypothetical protein